MEDLSEEYEHLLRYVKSNNRICPQPMIWNELYERLPNRKRVGLGWEPSLPLILAAWWDTPALVKQLRFLEHLEWAHKHGVLKQVAAFLLALPESKWHHLGE